MKVFVVGGAVRDVLLGRDPKDLDFVVVGSTPEEMLAQGFSQVGADFPVFLDKDGNEFALARTERKSGSGHTGFVTEFDPTVTLQDDLIRRDLTVNAMAVPVEQWQDFLDTRPSTTRFHVIDPFDGISDLERQTLRHVSDAFREDPLRVLRVARFAARFGFAVHDETHELMREMVSSGELDDLTLERVWKEMSRAMMEDHPHKFFDVLGGVGAMKIIAPPTVELTNLDSLLTPLVMRNATEKQRWMSVLFETDKQAAMEFIEMHKMPSDIATAIIFSIHMQSALSHGPDAIMAECKRFHLWHDQSLLISLIGMLQSFLDVQADRFNRLVTAVQEASRIGFNSLLPEEREGLTGIEVGEAIAAKRREVIVRWFESP